MFDWFVNTYLYCEALKQHGTWTSRTFKQRFNDTTSYREKIFKNWNIHTIFIDYPSITD